MTRPFPKSSPYIRSLLSRQNSLNLSRLPKLPEGAPPLISRNLPGSFDLSITSNRSLKAVDDGFARAVRLQITAEKDLKKESQTVTRFPLIHMPNFDIRLVPKKLLVVKEKEHSEILSKNLRNQRPQLSLLVITSKVAIHRFSVVRVRIKRKITSALDLIVRRGAFPRSVKGSSDHKLGTRRPRILLHDPALANPEVWILPDWAYIIYPRAKVFRMPLPDLVDQLRLGLQRANLGARAWQDRYMSPKTGEFRK